MLADNSTAIPLRQSLACFCNESTRYTIFSTPKQLIDPLSIFFYNPTMHANRCLSSGGFYLPDHDPPLFPPHTRTVIY